MLDAGGSPKGPVRSILGSLLHGRISGSLRKTRGPTSLGAFRHTHKPGVDLGWGNPCGKRQTRKRLNVGPTGIRQEYVQIRGLTPEGRISATRGRGLALSHSRYPVFSCRSRSRHPGTPPFESRSVAKPVPSLQFGIYRVIFTKCRESPVSFLPEVVVLQAVGRPLPEGDSREKLAGCREAFPPSPHNNSLRNHIILPR